jgi:sugar transferase (PEP-CTERM system associated)
MVRIFSQYVSVKSILLVLLESVLITFSVLCGVKLRFWSDPAAFQDYTALPDFAFQCLIIVVIFQLCFYYNDLYDLNTVRRRSEQLIRSGQSVGAACLILGLLYFLVPTLLIGRGVFFITLALVVTSVFVSRTLIDSAWQASATPQNALILGTGGLAQAVAQELTLRGDLGIHLVGFVETTVPNGGSREAVFRHRVVGSADELQSIAREHRVSRIIVATEDRRGVLPIRDLAKLRLQGIHVEDAQSAVASLSGRVWLDTVHPSWFVFSDGFRRSRVTTGLKRAIDAMLGLAALLCSLPIMLVVAIAIVLDSRGPILYRQVRVGLSGKTFEVLKFRSMREGAEDLNGAQWAQENDPRVTRLGRFLRKVRLDELPQFVNVIRGDMSFVGPRPERPVFVAKLRQIIPYYDERHTVRPGITGWAQVQYSYGASVEDAMRKLEYDLFYLKNMSILFDCAIVIQTVRIVLFGRGGR